MKAVISTSQGIENVKILDVPNPAQPTGNQVHIAIKAVGINQRDLINFENYSRWNRENPIPGCDGAGEVIAIGDQVSKWKVGDKVITSNYAMWIDGPLTPEKEAQNLDLCYTCDGCMCEVFAIHENALAKMPSHLSYEEAAVIPCTGVTAWNAVFTYGGLQSGQTVLILGTGGVSIFALKFAKSIGARAIVTGINEEVLEKARECGADCCINFTENPEWHKAVLEYTDGSGVDLVVETTGAATFNQSMMCTKQNGTISVVGFVTGFSANIMLPLITQRNIKLQGFRVGSTEHMNAMVNSIELIRLQPSIDSIFDLNEIQEAYKLLKSGKVFGKIAIRMN